MKINKILDKFGKDIHGITQSYKYVTTCYDNIYIDNLFNSTSFARQSSTSISSRASKTLPFSPPGSATLGSTDQAEIVSLDRPASRSAFPKLSFSTFWLSQFAFSARPSKGEAEAWTPLSPLFGLLVRPNSSYLRVLQMH